MQYLCSNAGIQNQIVYQVEESDAGPPKPLQQDKQCHLQKIFKGKWGAYWLNFFVQEEKKRERDFQYFFMHLSCIISNLELWLFLYRQE